MELRLVDYPVVHTPFVMTDYGVGMPRLFFAAGPDDRHLSLWTCTVGEDAVQIIAPESLDAISVCSPWFYGRDENNMYVIYATVAYDHPTTYVITEFMAPTLRGPYTVKRRDIGISGFLSYDSACIVGDSFYFSGIEEGEFLSSVYVAPFSKGVVGQWSKVDLPPPREYDRNYLMKPNVFKLGEMHLGMFVLELDWHGVYRTSMFSKMGEEPWVYAGEFPSFLDGVTMYKPFLYKGNFVMASRDADFTKKETWLDVHPVRLSELWYGFTDYPLPYAFPGYDA